MVVFLATGQDLHQSSRERRSCDNVIYARRARQFDEVGLHMRDIAEGWNRSERRILFHRGDGTERIGPWVVQVQNNQCWLARSHPGQRGF